MANSESANREVSHLVSMANDIAANLCLHSDAEKHIADHINRYWAPRMRSMLLEYAAAGGQGLSETLIPALDLLKE